MKRKRLYRRRQSLQEAWKRFPNRHLRCGTRCWLPRQLPERLKRLGAANWLHATLKSKAPARDGFGMHGSGMFIINPPWTLEQKLHQCLPQLAELLARRVRASAWAGEPVDLTASNGVSRSRPSRVRYISPVSRRPCRQIISPRSSPVFPCCGGQINAGLVSNQQQVERDVGIRRARLPPISHLLAEHRFRHRFSTASGSATRRLRD